MALQLGLDVSHAGGVVMVVVRGELDAATAPDLERLLHLLLASGSTEVALDLGDLAFIDSHGLAAMAALQERFEAVGGGVLLYRPSRLARHLLDTMGLHERFQIVSAGGLAPV